MQNVRHILEYYTIFQSLRSRLAHRQALLEARFSAEL